MPTQLNWMLFDSNKLVSNQLFPYNRFREGLVALSATNPKNFFPFKKIY